MKLKQINHENAFLCSNTLLRFFCHSDPLSYPSKVSIQTQFLSFFFLPPYLTQQHNKTITWYSCKIESGIRFNQLNVLPKNVFFLRFSSFLFSLHRKLQISLMIRNVIFFSFYFLANLLHTFRQKYDSIEQSAYKRFKNTREIMNFFFLYSTKCNAHFYLFLSFLLLLCFDYLLK